MDNEKSVVAQIVHHAMNKEPAKMTTLVNQEVASRVMAGIESKRKEVGRKLFNNRR